MYEYKAVIDNIVDGDTFDLTISLGFHITTKQRIRLLGIDTPESRGDKEKAAGKACTEYAKRFLGKEVIIKTEKTDSFGRWLADVEFVDNRMKIVDIYNRLGINKLDSGYNEENCFRLNGNGD